MYTCVYNLNMYIILMSVYYVILFIHFKIKQIKI